MKKIVILVIAIFLITGCSVKYNIVINEDLTVFEEAKLTGTTDFFANYYKTTRVNVLKSFMEIYQGKLEDNDYQYELVEENVPYVLVTRKYDNVNDYINKSLLFNGYFDEIKYTEDGNVKRIETIGYNDNDPDNSDRFNVKNLVITINCPYKVKNHNASRVDKGTNTYYYELNNEHNQIIFEYDAGVKFNPYHDVMIELIICMLLIAGIWIVIAIVSKKNNKNKE